MRLINLTLTIMDLNAAVDSGVLDDYTMEQAREDIKRKRVFPELRRRGYRSMIGTDEDLEDALHSEWERIAGAYAGDEGRKWGVQNKGLCLLIAWTNELIQLRATSGKGWPGEEQ